jgi:hypothetical protein
VAPSDFGAVPDIGRCTVRMVGSAESGGGNETECVHPPVRRFLHMQSTDVLCGVLKQRLGP